MITWTHHHRRETASTNADALAGVAGDVFSADFQTAGRGRLDHRWLSSAGANLMMSAVLDVAGLEPDRVATLSLVAGLSVAEALSTWLTGANAPRLKWPNDVLVGGRKIAGILCERHENRVIVGMGVNVLETDFPPEIAARSTSLALLGQKHTVAAVRECVLEVLGRFYEIWREKGFSALYPMIIQRDELKGKILSVRQTDSDDFPVHGFCGGIREDGTLDVGGTSVSAGEAHIEGIGEENP